LTVATPQYKSLKNGTDVGLNNLFFKTLIHNLKTKYNEKNGMHLPFFNRSMCGYPDSCPKHKARE
jgi:hypothetical protein